MNKPLSITRYNQRIPHMRARESTRKYSGLRLSWLTSFLIATVFLPTSLFASGLGDSARQLAHKIDAAAGRGDLAIETNTRSYIVGLHVRTTEIAPREHLDIE